MPLASTTTIESSDSWPIRKADNVVVVWTLFAMPLNWLEGDDECKDIQGVIEEDGTIKFNDDFAFLIKAKIQGEERGSYLSPIFKNLTLLKPNGTQSFTYSRLNADESGSGYGGLVPRKPGSSKPVSPRPISSIVGAIKPGSSNNLFSHLVSQLLHFQELQPFPFSEGTLGVGGLVPPPGRPGKPGSSRPKSTRPFIDLVNGGGPETDNNPVLRTGGGGSIDLNPIDPDSLNTTQEQVPVYVYKLDDTTLWVYNLFGLGNRCQIEIDKNNGTMYLPIQEIYNDGLGDICYNDASTGSWMNNLISWGQTKVSDGDYGSINRQFSQNRVTYTDSLPPKPVFEVMVMGPRGMSISAIVPEPYEVHLYRYDVETDSYTEVEGSNSVAFLRRNEPYWVYLAAQAYDPFSYVCGDMAYLEYQVPALGESILRGDVNDDKNVSIADVTALIDSLMTDDWDGKNYYNADCNEDGSVDISDVTVLIDYLLRGTWAE